MMTNREGLRKGLRLLGRLVLWTGVDARDTLAYRERLGDRLTLRERVTLRAWNWIIDRVLPAVPPLPRDVRELVDEVLARSKNKRHYYCLDCTDITDGDEDTFCLKCGSDNIVGFTDEEAREWAGLPARKEESK